MQLSREERRLTVAIDRSEPVIVVGAGIAGLTAALSLARVGFTVEVMERAAVLEDVGAGLQLSPNALRVLTALGVAERLKAAAVPAQSVRLRRFSDGRPLADIQVMSRDGTPYWSLHRADLQAALLSTALEADRISITLGAECTAVGGDGRRTKLTFRTSPASTDLGPLKPTTQTRSASLVIAADGVRSTVARALGHDEAVPSGDLAWRMTVPRLVGSSAGIEAWLGPGRHAVAYPVRNRRETNLVLIAKESDARAEPGSPGARDDLARAFARWDLRLGEMVAAADMPTAWPLRTADRRPRKGDPAGLLMIGDAAHAMLPYAAQGAAMAIEDAYVAAGSLVAAPTIEAALSRYHAERAPRIDRVRARVAFHRRVYHLPFPLSSARDLVLSARSPKSLAKDLAWLYDWQPPIL